jgi:hypothetical protein
MRLRLLLIIAVLAVPSLVMVDEANGQESFNKQEIFGGYTHKRTDFDEIDDPGHVFPSTNGFNIAYTRNVSRYFGIKGEFSAGFTSAKIVSALPPIGPLACTPSRCDTPTLTDRGGLEGTQGFATSVWDISAREMFFMGGVQIKDNQSESKIKPFAHVLGGVVRQNAKLNDDGVFVDDYVQKSFSMIFGGGIDFKIADRFSVRAIQFDYNPIFSRSGELLWSEKNQHTIRISTGIVFH